MFWLLFKVLPLGFIVRVLAIAALVTAAVFGFMAYSASAQSADDCSDALTNDEYEECINEHTDSGDSGDTADGPAGNSGGDDESTLFYHGDGVRLHSIEYNDGFAVVKMSSESGGEEVVITDSSRKTSGEMERYRYDLEEGMNTFRVPLHNPSNGAVTVDAAGRIYLDIDDENINLAPDKGHAIGVAFGGAAILIALLVGLHLWQTRRADEAKNPL